LEEDQLLDSPDRAERVRAKKRPRTAIMARSMEIISFFKKSLILLIILLAGCALPRIIVLDDPLTPEEHINLGVAYENRGELDNALKEYREASGRLPVAYLYMGNVFLKKNDLEEAGSNYEKAIEKEPRNADAHNNLAWLYYLKKENLDEAESLASRAIELNPSKEEIYRDTLDRIRALKASQKAGRCGAALPAQE
jgi:tetratricopeptide (TPR) repeat protein